MTRTKRGYAYRGHRSGIRSEDPKCPHGTVNGYVNFRCRCGDCRRAWKTYIAGRRRRARDAEKAPGTG